MIALAKYTGLDIIHVSTNLAPTNAPIIWYSEFEDTILIAKKPENWKANSFDKEKYFCEPADLKKMATGFIPLIEQPYFKKDNLKMRIKKYLKILHLRCII